MAQQEQPKPWERVESDSASLRDQLVAQLCLLTPQTFTEDYVGFVRIRAFVADELITDRSGFRSSELASAGDRRDAPDPTDTTSHQ